MKKIVKLLAVVSALILASSLFISCKDNDDDDDSSGSSSISAVFEGKSTFRFEGKEYEGSIQITFNENTWKIHQKYTVDYKGNKIVFDHDDSSGTYEGNPTKDGELKLKQLTQGEHHKSVYEKKLEGKTNTTVTIDNTDIPLENLYEPYDFTVTIKGNKLISVDGETTLTRK